jgi:uncharacterized membrane protein YgcG
MLFRSRPSRVLLLAVATSFAVLASFAPVHARAQDDDTTPQKHGRKYKAPPDTSHIEVTVVKGFNKKPIMNAAVIFHPVKDGKDEGNLEMKTDPDGKAVIDVIPTGSAVRIQVIADGFATFAEDYTINEASRQILITMARPKAQVSTFVDNSGKPADLKPGVQEPIRPKVDAKGNPIVPASPQSGGASSSASSSSGSAGSNSNPPTSSGDSSSGSGSSKPPQP